MLTRKITSAFWRFVARLLAPHLARTPVVFGDPSRVKVASSARLVNTLLNVQSGCIEIGENAFCGHDVSLLTGSHRLDQFGAERRDAIVESGRDIVVGAGVWINSGAIIIGPCNIGENAIVLAGSVVVGDVDAGTMVGGIPARLIRRV